MAYTTVLNCKTELPYNYQRLAEKKLTEDAWINVAGVFNETGFVQFFIDRSASFIEGYLSSLYTAPLPQSGFLEKINRILTTYEVELYLQSAQVNRGVNITIYTQWRDALKWLDRVLSDEIQLPIDSSELAPFQNTVRIIPVCGEAITDCGLEENVLFGTTDPMACTEAGRSTVPDCIA